VIAFAVKVPVWPFHTWLPDAHTEAPTAGSMILAGVLLKLGGFGFLRLVLPLFPAESRMFAPWLAALATWRSSLAPGGAYGQDDFKRLVAYSSINHMGFVVLGIAAAALALGHDNGAIAMNGAVLQMFNHGSILGRHVLPGGRDLRPGAYAQAERVWRVVGAAAGLWHGADLYLDGFPRAARPERLCV
jgi:NADH:ubiquinone oxidoreductase subunit 4 (subunit M)